MSIRRVKAPFKSLGKVAYTAVHAVARRLSVFHHLEHPFAKERLVALNADLARGKKCYIVGIGCGGHNAGVGLIEASLSDGIRLIGNHEEERFQGIKHFQRYPAESVEALLNQLRDMNIAPSDIHAVCASWDYSAWVAKAAQTVIEELPGSIGLLRDGASPHMNLSCLNEAFTAPRQLGGRLWGNGRKMPIIGLRHHDNHAWLSWGCSPFAQSEDPVVVLVVDGAGDDGAISAYVAENRSLQLLSKNDCLWDSLGMMYGTLSSALGGWPLLSSEGRYMGAAAWGDMNRLTNPYYSRLRDILVLDNDGKVFLNLNWPIGIAAAA